METEPQRPSVGSGPTTTTPLARCLIAKAQDPDRVLPHPNKHPTTQIRAPPHVKRGHIQEQANTYAYLRYIRHETAQGGHPVQYL